MEIKKQEETSKEALESIKKFFEADFQVKQQMALLMPEETELVDEESRIKYVDRLYKGVIAIEEKLKRTMVELKATTNISFDVESLIEQNKQKQFQKIAYTGYDYASIKKLYREVVADLNLTKLEEGIKKELYAGTSHDLGKVIDGASTLNELLHILHSYVMNNEEILTCVPIIREKQNQKRQPIKLRGEENKLAEEIFQGFPNDLDSLWTEILSMNGRTIIMIRDLGHALSIDIEPSSKSTSKIEYYIPKACNQEKVKRLPGINKKSIKGDFEGAYGAFEVENENLISELCGFIHDVPTDEDIKSPFDYEHGVEKKNNGIAGIIELLKRRKTKSSVLNQEANEVRRVNDKTRKDEKQI